MTNDVIIEVNHVSKQFEDGKFALDDVSLQVKKGEFVTILGPSGCGKTTLLRCIAGFQVASSGYILLKGEDVTSTPPYRRPVNTVFQKYALFPHLNVFDNVAFGLKMPILYLYSFLWMHMHHQQIYQRLDSSSASSPGSSQYPA